ncbi:MAG: HD domain-containing protein [Pyrodictiaceae archaeon]
MPKHLKPLYSLNDCLSVISECTKKEWCKVLLKLVVALYGNDYVHGLPHVIRVSCLSIKLARMLEAEGLNIDHDIIIASALLHDIGRDKGQSWHHHAVLSSIIASQLLKMLGFPKDKIEKVTEAIKEHSYSIRGEPSSLESCILSDADKIDAIGVIGVYRVIAYGERVGRGIEETIRHYYEKLKTMDKHLCLEVSRRLAEEHMLMLRSFFDSLNEHYSIEKAILEKMKKILER